MKLSKKYNLNYKLYEKQKGLCALCNKSIEREFKLFSYWIWSVFLHGKLIKRKECNLNIDHIIPRSLGGKDNNSNIQLTHITCNTMKGNKTVDKLP